ncbi:DUF2750 domain-containing protein [Aestuariibacter sp. AA17]|uniref:DUF2750 domain-containing protein n=1 Tax=Fluctibacter corallii TaxID=2984329 RepID=A0ABT3A947_9ALTE|nr:DUF2750 domain-containing protein [Aestuariibacter sp. AA17]MCV2885206.1 DUF2750 domain-containing protein [Aestuariibacter sp. AA17]
MQTDGQTTLSPDTFVEVSNMQPEARFDYMMETLIKQGELWGLFGKNGWLMLKADDDECLPIWPHSEFAKAWEKNDFPDCEPKRISLQEFQNKWLPGMKQVNHLVLAFPLSEDEEGIVLDADEMAECIQDERDAQG